MAQQGRVSAPLAEAFGPRVQSLPAQLPHATEACFDLLSVRLTPMTHGNGRRVAVTGLGVVTPIGNDLETVWSSLVEGVSGVGLITRFDASDYSARIAGEVRDFQAD